MKTLFFTGLVASLMMSSTALLGQGMSVSPEVVKASCKVRDGAVTKSFKISSSGKVDLRISCQADYIKVSPNQIVWGDNKSHSTEVKVVFFPRQNLVNSQPWKGEIVIQDLLSKRRTTAIYEMKCTY